MQVQKSFLESLNDREAQYLFYDWDFWAHPHQHPPEGDWRVWIVLGGRGAGKTRAGSEWIHGQLSGVRPELPGYCHRAALIAPRFSDVREIMIEGLSGFLHIGSPEFRPVYESSRRRLVWPNGAVAYAFSSEEPERIRGAQFEIVWADEFCAWSNLQYSLDMVQFGLRIGESPRMIITTTPKPVKALKTLMKAADTVVTRAATHENRAYLSSSFIQAIERTYGDSILSRQELAGEIVEEQEGALWSSKVLDRVYDASPPGLTEYDRIVVGVDPPVTSGENACACGIIVAGQKAETAWVLADCTREHSRPVEWAEAVVKAYHDFHADCVVVEVNQGGDLVEVLLRQIDRSLPIKEVRASRGKKVRAEPIAALYTRGFVFHAGRFPDLFEALRLFGTCKPSEISGLDRLDALVWALTELQLQSQTYPRIRAL